jgi:hypothetical protein
MEKSEIVTGWMRKRNMMDANFIFLFNFSFFRGSKGVKHFKE